MFSTGTNSKCRFLTRFFILITFGIGLVGCSVSSKPDLKLAQAAQPQRARLKSPDVMDLTKPPNIGALARGEVNPPTVEQASDELEKQGANWLYGKGVGATTLNIATCIVFPPYILYLLGNAGLEMAGYEPLYVTEAVPEPVKSEVTQVYDEVVSVPGRLAAGAADEEFRDR